MQLVNYSSTDKHWMWTGIRTLNQIWSYFYVEEAIEVTSIDAYWGGYDAPTSGKHFIAKWTPGNGAKLGGIIAVSDTVNVPQGRGWRSAKVKPVTLQPGAYAVGIWGHYLQRRTNGLWNGDGGGTAYSATANTLSGTATGSVWDGYGKGHVLPTRLNGQATGRMHIKAGGAWRDGQAHVKVNGTWRKAKSVWVKQNGAWRRGK